MENFDFDKVLEYMQWDKSHREYDDEGRCIGKSTWKNVCRSERTQSSHSL